jgi:hypothetical protein
MDEVGRRLRRTERAAHYAKLVYAHQRSVFDEVAQEQMRGGDDPAVIAKVVVAAATDRKPKLSYPAGSLAPRLSVLRRIVPARTFDKYVRKLNRMTA